MFKTCLTPLLAAAMIGVSAPVLAADDRPVIPDGVYGCETEKQIDRLMRAMKRNDQKTVDSMSYFCAPADGLEYALMQEGTYRGGTQVRVWLKGDRYPEYVQGLPVDVWIPAEAIADHRTR